MRQLLYAICMIISLGFNQSLACADSVLLPSGNTVLTSWGSVDFNPNTTVIGADLDTVVTQGNSVLIQGDFNGGRTKAIELYINRKLLATKDYGGKYQFKWDTTGESGTCQIRIAELRTDGQRYIIRKLSVEVIDESPIAITSPTTGSVLTEATPVQYNVKSGYTVSAVRLYANGALIGSISSDGLTWNVPVMPSGDYQLWLEADSSRGALKSQPVRVSIPTRVSLVKPGMGEKLTVTNESDSIKLAADIHQAVTSQKMEFFCDGAKVAEAAAGSKEADWNINNTAPGNRKLTVQVTDEAGHIYESLAITVNVNNPAYSQRQAEVAKARLDEVTAHPESFGPTIRGDEAQRVTEIQAKKTWEANDLVYLGWQYYLGRSDYSKQALRLLGESSRRKQLADSIIRSLLRTQSVPSDQAQGWIYVTLPGAPASSAGTAVIEGIPLYVPKGEPGRPISGFTSPAQSLALAIILSFDYSDLLSIYSKDRLTPESQRYDWRHHILMRQIAVLKPLISQQKNDPLIIAIASRNACDVGDLNFEVPVQNAMDGYSDLTLQDGLNAQVKEYSYAIAGFKAAMKLVPNSGTLRWRLAMAYHTRAVLRGDNKADYKEAISQYQTAIAIDKGMDIPAVREKIKECEQYSK